MDKHPSSIHSLILCTLLALMDYLRLLEKYANEMPPLSDEMDQRMQRYANEMEFLREEMSNTDYMEYLREVEHKLLLPSYSSTDSWRD